MVYGELGRHPVELEVQCRMLCYWAKLTSDKPDKLCYIMYSLLFHLYTIGVYTSPWLVKIRDMLNSLGLSYVWQNQRVENIDCFKLLVKTTLLDQYLQRWQAQVRESSKCSFYKVIKLNMQFEQYLMQLPYNLRLCMTKLRVSNHKLPIEALRHRGVERADRICQRCNLHEVGDEAHYLLKCKYFKQQRVTFLGSAYYNGNDDIHLYRLFNCSDSQSFYKLAKFVKYILNSFK